MNSCLISIPRAYWSTLQHGMQYHGLVNRLSEAVLTELMSYWHQQETILHPKVICHHWSTYCCCPTPQNLFICSFSDIAVGCISLTALTALRFWPLLGTEISQCTRPLLQHLCQSNWPLSPQQRGNNISRISFLYSSATEIIWDCPRVTLI